jgi:REP element-mobilizing transposase RayT
MLEDSERPYRSALRKGRRSLPNHAYFLTKCTLVPGTDVLARPDCAEIVIGSLTWALEQSWFRILGFVVMPDHYHVNIGLGVRKTLSQVMESIGKYTARRINKLLGQEGSFWEEGFYDHLIRNREDFGKILEYVHNNSVMAGLVESPEEWPYSTANPRYAHLVDWDWIGPNLT